MNASNPMKAPTRERTMTGETISSIGSFATYFGPGTISDSDTCQDDVGDIGQSMPVTPVLSDMMDQDDDVPLEQQVQRLKCRESNALDALNQVMEGIRIITRQMKRSHTIFQEGGEDQPLSETKEDTGIVRERSWSDSCCSTIQSCASDDDLRLSVLSRQLDGTIGAELLSLAHAAQMVGENSRLASEEASQSVHDVHLAQESIQQADLRVKKAESAVRIMYKKQKELIGQLEKANSERSVLKRQVKALMKEMAALKEQEHVVRALELHVANALQAHETQLALQQAKRKEENEAGDSGNIATVRLECPSQDQDGLVSGAAKGPQVHEEHFVAAPEPNDTKSSSSASVDMKSNGTKSKSVFNAVQDEKATKRSSAAQSRTSAKDTSFFAATQEVEAKSTKATSAKSRGGLGFGFGGSIRKLMQHVDELDASARPQVSVKKQETRLKEVEKKQEETNDNNETVKEPNLISPTNSVEGSTDGSAEPPAASDSAKSTDGISTHCESSAATTEASIATDGISPCNQASLISPSPTENGAVGKGRFFHNRSNKEQRRGNAKPTPAVGTKKALLDLDDASVDVTEGSQDHTFTSETIPASESFSTVSGLSCDVTANQVPPPTSLSCDTTGQVSPFTHDYAATVFDEKAFRSLALPAFVGPSPKNTGRTDSMAPDATSFPPELAEIAEIYAEIGQLHEC